MSAEVTGHRARRWAGPIGPVFACCLLLVFALVLWQTLVPIAVVALVLSVLFLRWQHGRSTAFGPFRSVPLLVMALFLLLHVVGMGWSDNMAYGLFDLEVKASFLVLPVLFWIWPRSQDLDTRSVLKAFCWVNAAAVLICLGLATWRFGDELHYRALGLLPADPAYTNHFFESRFSAFLHPSYMAMYLCMALGTWVIGGAWRDHGRSMNLVVVGSLLLGLVLCNSKMGWLTGALVAIQMLWTLRHEAILRRQLIGLLLVGSALFVGLVLTLPTVGGKITQAVEATGPIDPGSDQSSQLRRMVWDAALQRIRMAPWSGSGTGDVKDDLLTIYLERGYRVPAEKRMNAHGQFLQSTATLGVLGGALALALVLSLVIWGGRGGMGLLLGQLTLLNWSVESMAEVQAGVVFLGFMTWLLALREEGLPPRSSHQ